MAGTIDAGRLVFHVDADASKANAQLATYQDKLRTTEREISNTIQKINQLEKEFAATGSQKAAREIDNLKSKLQSLNVQAGATSAKISEMNKRSQDSQGILSRFGGASVIAASAMTALAYAAGRFVVSSVQAAAQVEQWAVSFRVLVGDAQIARDLLNDIREFGAVTPFETSELIPAAQMLLGMGTAAEDIVSTLQMVGDVSAGLNIPIGDMAYLFGQMQSQGKAMTQDLNQFAARGVPIYRTLAEMLNTDVAGIRRMAEQGQISFPLIQQAFERMTRAGGQFAGMMEAQSKTLAGRWSTFKDLVHETSVEFGSQLNPALKQSLEILTEMLESDPGQSTFFTQMGATIGATTNEINMLVQGLRILFAYYRSAEEEEIDRLTARFEELSALQERYDVIQSGGDLIVTFPQSHPGMEFQENVEGNLTGFYRNTGETAWRRIEAGSQLAAGLNIPQNQNPGGTPGGGPVGPSAIQLASEAADAAMAEYETQQNAYKTLLIAKAEADVAANDAQIKAQKEHWNGMLSIAQTAISGIMEIHQMATNAELQKIENDYNAKKKWINANVKDEKERAKQLEKLEEEKEKKIAAVKAKYAKEQKALMLMNAIVQTAAGITSALAMSGPPWVAIAMAAIVGAIGAAQVGLIAATPVPQAQYGGSFTVPPGYEADSGLLRVNSGERVDVTPERFTDTDNRDINISIDGESMRGYISREINRAVNSGSVQIRRRSAVRVS